MKIQYRTMYKLIMTLLAAAAALMIAGYVVLHPDISANQKEGSRLIGASYMTMNNEFYEILNEQISHRVEAEGDRLILRNPALSVSRQVEQIGKMLDEGISVLILTPVDSDGLTDILKKARQQGVKIIVVDSNVSDEQLVDCTIVSDNYRAGCLLGDYLVQNKENSKVVHDRFGQLQSRMPFGRLSCAEQREFQSRYSDSRSCHVRTGESAGIS